MKPITYNKYINKIGIEFEGVYSPQFISALKPLIESNLYSAHGDGSVRRRNEPSEYGCAEVITKPMNQEELSGALGLFNTAFLKKDYYLNDSTGLHFHLSLPKNYYYYLDSKDFYEIWSLMFRELYPDTWEERSSNNYCKYEVDNNGHFCLQSNDRYAFINYSYREHTTVEFRAYGGKLATIGGLRDLIQATIDLIGRYIPASERKCKAVKNALAVDEEIKRLNNKIDCDRLPTELSDEIDLQHETIEFFESTLDKPIKHHTSVFKIVPLDKLSDRQLWGNKRVGAEYAHMLYRREFSYEETIRGGAKLNLVY